MMLDIQDLHKTFGSNQVIGSQRRSIKEKSLW